MYNSVNQLCVHMHLLPFESPSQPTLPPTSLGYHRALRRAACAV